MNIYLALLPSGERLPVILDEDGIPMIRPLDWVISMKRPKCIGSNTITSQLRCLIVLYGFLKKHDINIEQRFLRSEALSRREIAGLISWIQVNYRADNNWNKNIGDFKAKKSDGVCLDHMVNRGRTIRDYIQWLGAEISATLNPSLSAKLDAELGTMYKIYTAMLPRYRGHHNTLREKIGLSEFEIKLLLKALKAKKGINWNDDFSWVRNALMVKILLATGIRRGELGGLKIEHINFQKSQMLIVRNSDDPNDPRRNQPLAKTRDRLIPIGQGVLTDLREYLAIRSKIPGARQSPFLIVTKTGMPIPVGSINKVFGSLRVNVDGIPSDFSTHTLRHTFASELMKAMEKSEIEPELGRLIFSEIMGWVPNSNMTATYTKRFVREEVDEVVEKMQSKMWEGTGFGF